MTQSRSDRAAAIEQLTKINIDDLVSSLGLTWLGRDQPVLRYLLRFVARRLAERVVYCDQLVGEIGLQAGGAWLLGQFVRAAEVHGQRHIPRQGPLLIIANHPGLYDTVAMFAAIPRDDLLIIAAKRPFLRALPNVQRYLLSIDEEASGRMGITRAAARHLRSGGALLLFPGGKIEPDPASMPGAIAALGTWSASIELFGRLVPEVVAVPAVVSGVLSRAALDHPLVRLRRTKANRELLAATLQIMIPMLHQQPVRVDFGPPIVRATVTRGPSSALGPAVLAATARLMLHVAQSDAQHAPSALHRQP